MERHLTDVHAGKGSLPAAKAQIKAIREDRRASRPQGRRSTGRWDGRRRLGVVVAILAVLILVVAYALLRGGPTSVTTGKPAPDFSFTTLSGSTEDLSSFQGHPVVLWWVAAFCSSCSEGTYLFSQTYLSKYQAAGVTLLEVESYQDLGQSGPSLATFASENGYSGQPGWVMGQGSSAGTSLYNPNGYLDVYYVIDSQGIVVGSGQGLSGSFGAALQEATG
jgi:hypothetical protein